MAGKSNLRAVKPGEAPVVAPPKNLKEAIDRDERALLVAMRKRIAEEIDGGVPPAYLAQLVRQLREVDKEIRLLDSREDQEATRIVSTADEKWTAI